VAERWESNHFRRCHVDGVNFLCSTFLSVKTALNPRSSDKLQYEGRDRIISRELLVCLRRLVGVELSAETGEGYRVVD
jgi:hypothetical protein